MKNLLSRSVFGAALLAGASVAAQSPALIPVQGFVTDDQGEPRDGEIVVDILLFTSAVDGDELHAESQVLDADVGYFSTEIGLGDELDLSIFANNGEVWFEIVIDDEVLEPRIQFGTAPYAAWAEWAGDARTIGGVTLEELQAATDWADLTGVPEDLLDGDDDTFDWSELTGIPEEFLDGDDVGESVDLSEYQLQLTDSCPEGSSFRVINADGTFSCEDDTDTTYSAGTGLSLLGTVFSIPDDAINSARLASNSVGNDAMQNDAIGSSEVIDNSLTTSDLADNSVGSAELADNSVDLAAMQNNSVGANEIVNSSVGSAELDANSVALSEMADNAVGNAEMRDNAIGNAEMLDDAIGSDEVIDDSIAAEDLQYGAMITLPMFPNAQTTSCGGAPVGGDVFGSTTSTTNVYIGNQFYSTRDSDLGLRTNFDRARLQITCRGTGEIELVNSCSASAVPVATITCEGGTRPYTATSDEFAPGSDSGSGSTASWNLRVRATSGTLEWAHPQVILY